MDWHNQQQNQAEQLPMQMPIDQLQNPDGLFVKVMTDEQMELLRRQISVYATICEQLVEMHKAMTAQQDLTGMRLGNLYCDPMMAPSGHKITARQRWTPTPVQLQMLERIFEEGNGTPSKQKIREIAVELSQHGQISEANVYNWFQNRRARSKRKQSVSIQNNADSEVETEVESPKEEKTKPVGARSFENLGQSTVDIYNQKSELNAEMQYLDAQSNKGEPVFHFRSCNSGHMGTAPNQRTDLTINKLEIPGSYNSYNPCEGYDLIE